MSLTSLGFCSAAHAADQKLFGAPQSSASAPVSAAGGLAQITLSLVLVLAAVFAAAWVVRRMRTIGRPHGGALKVLADVAVGTKERVVLVQVHEQQVLIGVATGSVNVLHVLPPGTPLPSKDVALPAVGGAGPGRPDFKSLLKRSLGLR